MTPVRPHLGLVVAVARGGVIGHEGKLPWHEPEDLRHFKAVTMGHALVMGWTTHASIGRALPGRRNLVLTSSGRDVAAGCESFASLADALDAARSTDDCPMVIGGARVYEQVLADVTHLFWTDVDLDVEGDTWFPDYEAVRSGTGWTEHERRASDDGKLVFRTLLRAE